MKLAGCAKEVKMLLGELQVKRGQRVLKRQIDFWGAVIGFFTLAVPFAVIALAIKLDSKGPVFFRQERVGKNGGIFKPWKFRTMVVGAVNQGLGYNVRAHHFIAKAYR